MSSTTRSVSPSGSKTTPGELPDGRTRFWTRASRVSRPRRRGRRSAVAANGLTASTSAPSLASTGVRPPTPTRTSVEHELEPVAPDRLGRRSTAPGRRCSTRGPGAGRRCRRCRRRRPAGSRPGLESRSILRLAPSSMSRALGVEEADLDAGGVVGAEPDGHAPLGPLGAHVEPGQRDGRQLEVLHVDARQVEPDITARLRVRATREVSRLSADHRPLLEAGAVGGGQADGQLGGDVDVGQAPDAPAAEQGALPPALPDDRGVDDRPGLDRLVGVDLDALG